MKKIILIIIIYSSAFSLNWKNDFKEVGTHGENFRAEWTKLIKMPVGCERGEERRLDEIVLISTNILDKKPSEWLEGKYLQYVNESCNIWSSLRGNPEDFEKIVDNFFKSKADAEKSIGNKFIVTEISFYLMLSILSAIPLLVSLIFFKEWVITIKRMFFS